MSKEKKPQEKIKHDPDFISEEFAYNNMLSLPQALKDYLNGKDLDWRFLNAAQFRRAGNYHRSHWKPLNATSEMVDMIDGITAEGLIQRGDLILGVRPKAISVKHRESLAQKARRMGGFAQESAKQMKDDLRRKGISGIKIEEGYDEDDKGFKSP